MTNRTADYRKDFTTLCNRTQSELISVVIIVNITD
jgi:hypothetical protein